MNAEVDTKKKKQQENILVPVSYNKMSTVEEDEEGNCLQGSEREET